MNAQNARIARIPRKIHYCWFGGQPLSDDAKSMIATWRRYCPDYEIIEWNESNFNINENDYVREAYEAKKWAFVTDYVRLKVLYEQGGFYMDTDVEVVKSLDSLRVYDVVSGYESQTCIATGTIGACRDNEWIGMLLRDYSTRHFILSDGTYDMTTNVVVISHLTAEYYNFKLDGMRKEFGENMILLPFDYLCAKSYLTGEVIRTDNTYTIHHFKGSWLSDDQKRQVELYRKYYEKLSYLPFDWLNEKVAKVLSVWQIYGWNELVKRVRKKFNQ